MRRVREGGDVVDVMILTPEKGKQKEVGQRLFDLVARLRLPASTVQWVTWPKTGYAIPVDLFIKFEEDDGKVAVDLDEELLNTVMTGSQHVELVEPRRRGRPRKNTAPEADGADNNTSKEE